MKLLIRNLDRETTVDTVKTLFQEYGSVQSCVLVMDKETGKSKGFGFVEMPKAGEAKAAMISVNGKTVDGHRLRVKKSTSKNK